MQQVWEINQLFGFVSAPLLSRCTAATVDFGPGELASRNFSHFDWCFDACLDEYSSSRSLTKLLVHSAHHQSGHYLAGNTSELYFMQVSL